jgi:hypothetical protein
LPRAVPLSRLIGATPTRLAISRRENSPSSGIAAISRCAVIGPMPGTLCNRLSVTRQSGVA